MKAAAMRIGEPATRPTTAMPNAPTKRITLPAVKTVMPPERASQPPATKNSPMFNRPAREIRPEVVASSMPYTLGRMLAIWALMPLLPIELRTRISR